MYELISMLLALALLVLLLRAKVRLGRAMVIAAVAVAVLLRVTPGVFWQTVLEEWRSKPLTQTTGYLFVTLTALIIFVNVLGEAMKHTQVSQRLVPAVQGLFKSRRAALAGVPLMMGLLPTPGGIMLSAPLVRDLGDQIGVERSRSAAINYFFRHQWETVWPLFPAVPLIQSMLNISAFNLIAHNLVIVLAGISGGVIFLLLAGIPPRKHDQQIQTRFLENLRSFTHAFWPIALVAALYAGLNISPAVGILLAIIIFLLLHKVPCSRWPQIFKSGLEVDFALLVLGALLFKLNLQAGHAVPAVVEFFSQINVPEYLLIFLLPMLVAFLTGVTMPTAAMTFPFLLPFIGTGRDAKLALEVLAFSGLVCGIYSTPVHLCLALSAGYFEAPLGKIIIKVLGPLLCIAAAGMLIAAFFK
jgi:integral membrane protein (TIGR00529 family)